jgi:DNA-binding response OmpR family regulator
MRPRALVAVADAALSEALRRFFAERGFDVEVASEARAYLAKVLQLAPSVVLLDVNLPSAQDPASTAASARASGGSQGTSGAAPRWG